MNLDWRSSWRGYATVFGGAFITMSCGQVYSYGNLTPYVVSYIRKYGRERDLTYQIAILCSGVLFFMNSLGSVAGTWMEKNCGPRKATLSAIFLSSLGILTTYWSIKASFYLLLLTYGFLFGFATGSITMVPLVLGMRWFPRRRGLVCGFLIGSAGIGSTMFNFIQTLYINPANHQPNDIQKIGDREEIYYTQESVLCRVRSIFLVQGVISVILQSIGLLLHFDTVEHHQQTEMTTLLAEEKALSSSTNSDHIEQVRDRELSPRSLKLQNEGNDCNSASQGVTADEETEVISDPLSSGLSLSLEEVIRRPYIWQYLAMTGSCLMTGAACIGTYKAFGLIYIRDDLFLASIGSLAAIFNFFGHFLVGAVIDHFSIKITSIAVCGMMSFLVLIFPVTPLGGKAPFLLVVCGIFFLTGGTFAIQPVLALRAFGEKHFVENSAIIFILGGCVSNILGSLVTLGQKFLTWTTIYISFGILPGLAMIAGMFMRMKNLQGNDV